MFHNALIRIAETIINRPTQIFRSGAQLCFLGSPMMMTNDNLKSLPIVYIMPILES